MVLSVAHEIRGHLGVRPWEVLYGPNFLSGDSENGGHPHRIKKKVIQILKFCTFRAEHFGKIVLKHGNIGGKNQSQKVGGYVAS